MRLLRLQAQSLRCFMHFEMTLDAGMNVFVGPNGAGKTSVLEAVYVLSHGRSFRHHAREALTRRGERKLTIFTEMEAGRDTSIKRLGLGREGARWQAKIDGATVSLSTFVRQCAVICFEPGSHALIAGGADERRHYLDWGVFHVEQDFLSTWRRYQRALKQRNTLLRSSMALSSLLYAPWEEELSYTAEQIHTYRQYYLSQLFPELQQIINQLIPELGAVSIHYRQGWPEGQNLAAVLHEQREKDRLRGHTTAGVHRADWRLFFEQAPVREHLSRGQEKVVALACLLAQAQVYQRVSGEWPIICLDDLTSELDIPHQQALIHRLHDSQAQVLLTATEKSTALQGIPHHLFHVEQGKIISLL